MCVTDKKIIGEAANSLAGKSVYLFGGGSRGDIQPLVAIGNRLQQETGAHIVLFAGCERQPTHVAKLVCPVLITRSYGAKTDHAKYSS